jgi:CubicO group peptidase (beta-lactamase class C family)
MRIRSVFSLAALCAIFVAGVGAQGDLAPEADRIFAQFDRPESAGCSVALAKDGKTVFAKGYGSANLEHAVPMTPTTVSESGSVAKQFVAGAIVLLARQGMLSLDDDIRKYLPEVPDFGKRITIRNLLSHTSGLRDQNEFFGLMGLPMGRSVHTNDEILEIVTRQRRLNFDPGTEYLYSNTGYTLLVHIIRRAGGKSLAEFTSENIFKPLGMNSTEWREDFTKTVRNRASAYVPDGKGGYRLEMPFGNVHGAGGLLTTVGDLLIWNENFSSGKVGGDGFGKTMEEPARLKDGTAINYALGLGIGDYNGETEISHSGATAGYRTYLARYPKSRLSVALLCNAGNASTAQLARRVANLILKTEAPYGLNNSPHAIAIDNAAGLYRNLSSGEVVRISAKNGELFAGFGGDTALGRPFGESYRVGNTSYVFAVDERTKIVSFIRRAGSQPPVKFLKVSDFKPDPKRLAAFAGDYFSDELLTVHTVRSRDGKLFLRVAPLPEIELVPLDEDAYRAAGTEAQLSFTRDRSGAVDGYTVFTGRIRHLRFARK